MTAGIGERTARTLRWPNRREVVRFLWGTARVQAYLGFVTGSLLLVTTSVAYSHARQVSLELGEQWVGQLAPLSGQVERVSVNGAQFSFATLLVHESASEVLSKVEQDCYEHSGDLTQEFGQIAETPQIKAAMPDLDVTSLTTGRRDGLNPKGAAAGDVVCALRDSGKGELGILDRLKSFSETGNLSDFGKMRYVRADSLPNGKGSRLLALWTDDPLNLERMFSDSADASGSDPLDVARPGSARRIFSGVIQRSGDGVYGYESTLAPGVILASYDQSLPEKKWLAIKLALRGDPAPVDSRAFIRDGRATVITATRDRVEQPTSVAIVVLEARRVVTIAK